MSKVNKWKPEKLKVKVVFRLQFHATHIPQKGWEKLFISFIPTDTGKATAKTSKANVRNGICKWADPVYETTRLLLDSTSKQYDDKLYRLVVGLGTSRSSILGEATLNLADYADASQPAAISLPLTGSDHGTILHVSVQLLTSKTGFREFEQQRDKGLQSGNNVNKETEPSTARSSYSDLESLDDPTNKAKTQVQTNIHEECSDSPVTFDGSSNASESYNAHDVDSFKNKVSVTELKTELSLLQSRANEMGNETEKFSQELANEIASGQELSKEVTFLKSECSKLKTDLKKLTEMKPKPGHAKKVKRVDGVLLLEDQIRNLQEKVYAGSHERDNLKSDFEVLFNTVQDLKNETIEPESKRSSENENLVKKMNQMESYYEGLVQELEENQKRILGEFQTLKAVNNELQKRATTSESALKRARLNYSIAVSQLQKDLDMLSFQVLSMFETNQTVIKESFLDTSPTPVSKNLVSDDMKKSLSIQETIYKKVEEELGEMCSVNVHLDVYSAALKETLFDASSHIRKTNQKLQLLNQSRDVLNARNGNLSNENFLLMEKITECEALLADYKFYKSKHDVEKRELEDFLRSVQKENDDLKRTFTNTLRETVTKMETPNVSLDKLRLRVDSVADKFKTSLESGEKYVENGEVIVSYLSDLELELEKMLSEAEKSKLIVSELKKENEDLKNVVENKHTEISKLVSELSHRESENSRIVDTLLKERAAEDLKLIFVKTQYEDKLDELMKHLRELKNKHMDENETLSTSLEYVRFELEASLKSKAELQTKMNDTESRLYQSLENEARYMEENGKLSTDLESLRLELLALVAHNAEILESKNERAVEVGQLRDMLTKSESEAKKYIELQTKLHDTESRLDVFLEENEKLSKNLESLRLELEATESRLNICLENETRHVEEHRKLVTELENVRLELEASVAQNAHLLETSKKLEQWKNKAGILEDELNDRIASQARYVEENEKLSTALESLNSEILESKNEHDLEVGQLKDMLSTLEAKLDVTESRLNQCLENEARYTAENESLRYELNASVVHNAEILESKNERAVEAGKYIEFQAKLHDTESRLNDCLEENEKLSKNLESLRLELEASVSRNSEILESKKEQYKELKLKLVDTESRLNQCLENEARCTAENGKLSETVESLRLELSALVARNAEILESKNERAVEAGKYIELQIKLQDTESRLDVCLENETRHVEEHMKLVTELENVRLEFEASVAQNAHLLESNDKLIASEARYVKENEKLTETVESLRFELNASVAHNAEILESKNEHVLEADQLKDILTKLEAKIGMYSKLETKLFDTEARYIEESEIVSIVLKAKIDELKNKLVEQCLKTEEYKNLSTYLKDLKENGEKKDTNNPESPSESLRLAFIKEQYQAKIQDLTQQLSVTKKHNEEMLFKLQNTLEELESVKKSDNNKRDYDRIQAELECAILSLECCKEEKEKLVGLLREREDEKTKLSEELGLVRAQNGYSGVNGSAIQGVTDRAYGGDEDSLVNNEDSSKQLTVLNDQFRAQHLRSCMEQLDEELERMKNDNTLLPLTNYDPSVQDLQRELAQLRQANEELGSIYPNFLDFPGNGNALERVLALEIELAEALRNKKKPSIQFQSSFLKQHTDDEAIFKSFRDINELIKDMLEIKGKYVNVESELKEMHDRYSQLSLQFAEVEGERQKLMMTLKNVRSSRNLLRRSSLDHSPL